MIFPNFLVKTWLLDTNFLVTNFKMPANNLQSANDVYEADVLFTPYPAGRAFKATLPRLVPAGEIGDTDVYGAQQHAPLLDIEL